MSNKSKELIPKIISAKSQEDAIEILNDVVQMLYVSSDYKTLVSLKDELEVFKGRLRDIVKKYRSFGDSATYDQLSDIRLELGFLYQECTDSLVFKINSYKVAFTDERRSAVRAEAILSLKKTDPKLSDTAAHNIYGSTDVYHEYLTNHSTSYGLYKECQSYLDSIKLLIDAIASKASKEITILKQDIK